MRRIIEMWYDVNAEILRASPSGSPLRVEKFPWITLQEKPLVNLTLVKDASLTPQPLPTSGIEFEASVDEEFQSSALMCKTLNSGINQAGDWGEGAGTADPAQGQVSIKLNAANQNFLSRIGTAAEKLTTKLELIVTETISADVIGVYLMPFTARNLVGLSSELPMPVGNFVWFINEDTGASCLRIVNNDGEVLGTFKPVGV